VADDALNTLNTGIARLVATGKGGACVDHARACFRGRFGGDEECVGIAIHPGEGRGPVTECSEEIVTVTLLNFGLRRASAKVGQ
jgi:hypothetical protein